MTNPVRLKPVFPPQTLCFKTDSNGPGSSVVTTKAASSSKANLGMHEESPNMWVTLQVYLYCHDMVVMT